MPTPPGNQKPTVLEGVAHGLAAMTFTQHCAPLQQLLDDGRCAYTIRRDGRGLVRWVDAPTIAMLDTAALAADQPDRGSAATHLRRAYQAAYQMRADPVRACSEAIKAVASAAHATLEPNNGKATLGSMRRALRDQRDQRDQLTVALPGENGTEGVQTVESMIMLLWTGQSRHGHRQTTRDETIEEARLAVSLAASLVQWFSTGTVRRH